MPKIKPPEQVPMSVQPSGHGSTVPTQSLPRRPNADLGLAAPSQRKRLPDEEVARRAHVREGIRLDALKKQRKAMKR